MTLRNIVNAGLAGFGAFIGFTFGKINGLFIAFVTMVVLDYITGVVAAIINKNLNSEISVKGLLRKFLFFIIVATANIIDDYILGQTGLLRSSMLILFIANDGISILENCGKCGIPIPKKLMSVLEQLHKKNDTDDFPSTGKDGDDS